MLRLVAPPLPGRALAVVYEAKEPVRGRHGGDATRAAARRVPDDLMPGKRRFGRVREQRGGGFVSGPPKVNQPMPDRKPFAVPVADRWRPQFSARSGTDALWPSG